MSRFWNAYDECKREVRREAIVKDRIVALRPDLPVEVRASLALQTLESATRALSYLGEHLPADAADRLKKVQNDISAVQPQAQMRRSLVHLLGVFGKAP